MREVARLKRPADGTLCMHSVTIETGASYRMIKVKVDRNDQTYAVPFPIQKSTYSMPIFGELWIGERSLQGMRGQGDTRILCH